LFDIEPFAKKAVALEALSEVSRDDGPLRTVAALALKLASEARDGKEWTAAQRLCFVALKAARKTNAPEVTERALEIMRDASAQKARAG
jgi:hypothetical protein